MAIQPAEIIGRQLKSAAFGFLYGRTPLKRVMLQNLDTDEMIKVQFNPTTFTERLGVNYTAHRIRGLPHEPLDYENTENLKVEMEFYADDFMRTGAIPLSDIFNRPKIKEFKNFLLALCYPPSGARGPGLADAAPPRVLVHWPKTLLMTAVVRNLEFENVRFDWKDSEVTTYIARVQFEETRSFRLTSEEVRTSGNEMRTYPPSRRAAGQGAQFLLQGF